MPILLPYVICQEPATAHDQSDVSPHLDFDLPPLNKAASRLLRAAHIENVVSPQSSLPSLQVPVESHASQVIGHGMVQFPLQNL